jgi:two-component system NtrC family response regulator
MENRINGAVIMADGNRVTAADLELDAVESEPLSLDLRHVRQQAERQAVQNALAFAAGNVSQAAELLGVTRPTLYDLVRKHDLAVSE